MNIYRVRNDIFIVENFYPKYKELYNVVINSECLWELREDRIKNFNIDNDTTTERYSTEFVELCNNYIFCLEETVENVGNFYIGPTRGNFIIGFSIYEKDTFINKHKDTYDIHDANNQHVWSSVHYLNSNFTGGEIVFVDIDLEIKPLENMLLVFNSNYLHETKKIKSGQKICGTRFWKSRGNKQ